MTTLHPATQTPAPAAPVTVAATGPADPVTAGQLASLAFFDGLSPEHLEAIVPHTKLSHFDAGDVIFEEHDLADRFYILLSGRVAIDCRLAGETVRVQEIGPGDSVGFSWFFTPENLHFTARVLEPVEAVFFYGTLLRADCDLDPRLGYELMQRTGRVIVQRMESLISLLSQRAEKTC